MDVYETVFYSSLFRSWFSLCLSPRLTILRETEESWSLFFISIIVSLFISVYVFFVASFVSSSVWFVLFCVSFVFQDQLNDVFHFRCDSFFLTIRRCCRPSFLRLLSLPIFFSSLILCVSTNWYRCIFEAD